MLSLDILGEMKCIPQVSYVFVFKLTTGEFKSTSTGFFVLVYCVMSSQKKGGELSRLHGFSLSLHMGLVTAAGMALHVRGNTQTRNTQPSKSPRFPDTARLLHRLWADSLWMKILGAKCLFWYMQLS